jgi:taurine dioxygenase
MITVKKITPVIGAEIRGVDLRKPLSDEEVRVIRKAWIDNLVVFFKDQELLSDEEHIRLGAAFGTLDLSEIQPTPHARKEILVLDQVKPKGEGADNWHRDRTYLDAPPLASFLQCRMKPESGGDTCWMSMYAAYEALSAPIRGLLDTLYARHSIEPLAQRSKKVRDALGERLHSWPSAYHPVVEVHPESGRKALNVNANWTCEIVGVTKAESDALLGMLFEHVKQPEFQVRYQWTEGDVAFWDNRCTLHYAIADYTSRRVMQRVALVGHKPVGPFPMQQAAE